MVWNLERTLRIAAWAVMLAIVVVTLGPIGVRPETALPANAERFVAYAVLGLLFGLAYPRHRLPVVIILAATAGILEAGQGLELTRHATLMGFVWKAAGALAGVAASFIVMQTRRAASG